MQLNAVYWDSSKYAFTVYNRATVLYEHCMNKAAEFMREVISVCSGCLCVGGRCVGSVADILRILFQMEPGSPAVTLFSWNSAPNHSYSLYTTFYTTYWFE